MVFLKVPLRAQLLLNKCLRIWTINILSNMNILHLHGANQQKDRTTDWILLSRRFHVLWLMVIEDRILAAWTYQCELTKRRECRGNSFLILSLETELSNRGREDSYLEWIWSNMNYEPRVFCAITSKVFLIYHCENKFNSANIKWFYSDFGWGYMIFSFRSSSQLWTMFVDSRMMNFGLSLTNSTYTHR